MDHISEPTPAINAENLKEALINADLYDERHPSTSISYVLSMILHLIDAERASSFDILYEQGKRYYDAEVMTGNRT